MYMMEPMEIDPARSEANRLLAEASRDAVNLACERMIPILFSRFQKRLGDDREALAIYDMSGMPEKGQIGVFVGQTSVDAPMPETPTSAEDFNQALSLKLVFEPLLGGGGPTGDEGDVIYVYMPIPRPDYQYPDPLQGPEIRERPMGLLDDSVELSLDDDGDENDEQDDSPVELYFEYIPNPEKQQPKVRYTMQRDIADPKQRYGLFRYTLPYDGDEAKIYDSFTFDDTATNVSRRMPENSEATIHLLNQIGDFNEVIQKYVNPHPPIPYDA